jgi:hypothetical protein
MTNERNGKDASEAGRSGMLETNAGTPDLFTVVVTVLLIIGLASFAWLIVTVGMTHV